MDNNNDLSNINKNSICKLKEKNNTSLNLAVADFSLYLNVIGGHSLFIEISPNLLIKSASENEIMFYEHSYEQCNPSIFIPHYNGKILRNSENFAKIENYVIQCKKFFKNYILKNKLTAEEINIEKEQKFLDIFAEFIKNKKENEGNTIVLNKSFEELEKKLDSIQKSKLKWILFWFIKWKENFLSNDYIIIENLTFNMNFPAILDIKLGSSPRYSKEKKTIKVFGGATNQMGCRIMGLQKNFNFKNRYDTKNFTIDQFHEEIFNFFINNSNNQINVNLINQTLKNIAIIKKEVQENKHFLMKFSSILIVYDFINDSNVRINLIDFSYYEQCPDSKEYLFAKNDFLQSLNNLIKVLEECKNTI